MVLPAYSTAASERVTETEKGRCRRGSQCSFTAKSLANRETLGDVKSAVLKRKKKKQASECKEFPAAGKPDSLMARTVTTLCM